ncbi:MAG: transcription termination/antitermination protein NusG [Myxococcales bacterium]|jgi:transcriptional antiterminator NusG|nr:transcription termination/antitermination protein NusG [Myxococcales bacterium]
MTEAKEIETGSPLRKRWYVVHTYSGFENKAKKSLEERIKSEGMDEYFGEVLIPTEQVVEMVKGTRRTSKRKCYPGYILVELVMNERSWHLVKSTPKVTGFVGGTQTMEPDRIPWISDDEARRLMNQMSEDVSNKPKPKVEFSVGDNVRVIDGPFANFNGAVEGVDNNKGRVKVSVSIFGRPTPVDLDFMQVEKAS